MKILVCGSRKYDDKETVDKILSGAFIKGDILVQGDAPGADTMARKWAELNGFEHLDYPAEWLKFGKAAGPIRNEQMLRENPDIEFVIAFKDGFNYDYDPLVDRGQGTEHMAHISANKQIPVTVIDEGSDQKMKDLYWRNHGN